MIIYHQELKAFNVSRLKYIIVGGVAFNLLGGFRSTADLDILIDMTAENLSKLLRILKTQGYRQLQPINPLDVIDAAKMKKLARDKHMKALSFFKENSLHQIDVIIESPVSFKKAKESVIVMNVDGLKLPVVGVHELMTMKKKAWRPIDQADFMELKTIKKMRGSSL